MVPEMIYGRLSRRGTGGSEFKEGAEVICSQRAEKDFADLSDVLAAFYRFTLELGEVRGRRSSWGGTRVGRRRRGSGVTKVTWQISLHALTVMHLSLTSEPLVCRDVRHQTTTADGVCTLVPDL